MRPYYILVLTLALVFAMSNAALAAPAANPLTAADNEDNIKRSLRSTAADEEDEEERFLGIGKAVSKVNEKVQLQKMRKTANKEMKAKSAEAAKAAKAAKAAEKAKTAEAAKAAKAAEKAKAAEAAKAAKAAKAAEKAKAAEAAKAAKAAKAQGEAAKKAAKQKEKEDKMMKGWLAEMRNPNKVHKDLGLSKLGDKAKDSPLYPFYQRYEEAYRMEMRARTNGVAA
ncbi:hypothetical protein PHYBOEH_004178 [Phytophthora boehmeriae]|uniref:RxLR effector protein n=1 Tax=Phytophthora boehmeriae TaxID=109152 RepID=A0A8T1WTF7_9STRA|nr:hypothetical protein PHYBOEH_004178 [Phytophthora boehmeriae]